jgi:hypothetical protein
VRPASCTGCHLIASPARARALSLSPQAKQVSALWNEFAKAHMGDMKLGKLQFKVARATLLGAPATIQECTVKDMVSFGPPCAAVGPEISLVRIGTWSQRGKSGIIIGETHGTWTFITPSGRKTCLIKEGE